MWKHLLVPTDFSGCADRALALAVRIAAPERTSLTLVHVSPLPPNLPPDALVTPPGARAPIRIDEYTTGGARSRLDSIAAPLREQGLDVRVLALASTNEDVSALILRAARDCGADAIVVGTHGRTGLSHLLLGSVAEKVIRTATIPVVTVRFSSPESAATSEDSVAEDEIQG